jgi:hypothetical protein
VYESQRGERERDREREREREGGEAHIRTRRASRRRRSSRAKSRARIRALDRRKVFLSDKPGAGDSYTLQPVNYAKVNGSVLGVDKEMVAQFSGIDWGKELGGLPGGNGAPPAAAGARSRRKSSALGRGSSAVVPAK